MRRVSKLERLVLCAFQAEPTEHTRADRAIYIKAQLTRPEIDRIMIAGLMPTNSTPPSSQRHSASSAGESKSARSQARFTARGSY